jgi:hypothetical protein
MSNPCGNQKKTCIIDIFIYVNPNNIYIFYTVFNTYMVEKKQRINIVMSVKLYARIT